MKGNMKYVLIIGGAVMLFMGLYLNALSNRYSYVTVPANKFTLRIDNWSNSVTFVGPLKIAKSYRKDKYGLYSLEVPLTPEEMHLLIK